MAVEGSIRQTLEVIVVNVAADPEVNCAFFGVSYTVGASARRELQNVVIWVGLSSSLLLSVSLASHLESIASTLNHGIVL